MTHPDPASPVNPAATTPRAFNPRELARSVITAPLAQLFRDEPDRPHSVVIDININYADGRAGAVKRILEMLAADGQAPKQLDSDTPSPGPEDRQNFAVRCLFNQYVVVYGLTADKLEALAETDVKADAAAGPKSEAPRASRRAIFRIWPNFKMSRHTIKSVATVKADAAHNAFAAYGENVVWAVLDSGIDGDHPHFKTFDTLTSTAKLHKSFVDATPLADTFGHGTHVAGIIAGASAVARDPAAPVPSAITRRVPDPTTKDDYESLPVAGIAGMASRAQLVSLKILRDDGTGDFSDALAAIEYIQEVNGYGRTITIHGANLSAGYSFDPDWFACGQSPLCVEVDRLARSGVVVVVAAGNSGYGLVNLGEGRAASAGLSVTIADPGNSALAITVGSTHREMPHMYGVSYFSSKGPTGDGRAKPDLVAPGERIISCASAPWRKRITASAPDIGDFWYTEDSGTSMATPHVSGVIAAFLSIRREFVGRPDEVKRIFLETATDLGRERYFQGAGLVDLMRAIQSA